MMTCRKALIQILVVYFAAFAGAPEMHLSHTNICKTVTAVQEIFCIITATYVKTRKDTLPLYLYALSEYYIES